MPRPPRKLSGTILRTLDKRPKLRYSLTSKGSKVHSRGELAGMAEDLIESLIEGIDANNSQPVSLQTWKRFHSPKKIEAGPLRTLVSDGLVSIVSRSKGSFALKD